MKAQENKQLKSKRFLAWRVGRTQERAQQKAVHKALFQRERLRSEVKH